MRTLPFLLVSLATMSVASTTRASRQSVPSASTPALFPPWSGTSEAAAWSLQPPDERHAPPTLLASLNTAGTPLADSLRAFGRFGAATRAARIIALGEATHGQHEVFDLKRRLTMHLVRHRGVRLIAYEASASLTRRIDAWLQTAQDTSASGLADAMNGFGMLIWFTQENAALLRDLHAWNRQAKPGQRVRFIGVDAQDGEAVAARLRVLIGARHPALAAAVDSVVAAVAPATDRLYRGQPATFDTLSQRARILRKEIDAVAARSPDGDEIRLRSLELFWHATMWGTPGGRDKAMAELLLAQLPPSERVVVWAHNEHLRRGVMPGTSPSAFTMGGHLANRWRDRYYVLGFTYGVGGFQANAQDSSGRWGYRHYMQGPPSTSYLESVLLAAFPADVWLDLRSIPAGSPAHTWLRQPQLMRWWGGYQVPDDPDSRFTSTGPLPKVILRAEYDGLVFHRRTTPAMPTDRTRLFRSPTRTGDGQR